MNNATIHVRVNEQLKHDAESVLHTLGLSISETIRLMLKQVMLTRKVPFEIKLPNKETAQAIDELEAGKGTKISLDEFEKQLK